MHDADASVGYTLYTAVHDTLRNGKSEGGCCGARGHRRDLRGEAKDAALQLVLLAVLLVLLGILVLRLGRRQRVKNRTKW